MSRNRADVPCAKLRAKAAAHEFRDDAHLTLLQLEDRGKLVAHARRSLRGCVNGQAIRFPVCDDAMRFQRGVRLHLRAEFSFDSYVCLLETFLHISERATSWATLDRPTHVSFLRDALRPAAATGCFGLICRAGKNQRRVRLMRFVRVNDKWQWLVVNFN